MDFSNTKKKGYIYIILILLLVIISLNGFIIYQIDKLDKVKEDVQVEETVPIIKEEISNKEVVEPQEFFIDIKGAINNPGVYLVNEGSIVNDQTTPNMIQRISRIFERNPLISKEI